MNKTQGRTGIGPFMQSVAANAATTRVAITGGGLLLLTAWGALMAVQGASVPDAPQPRAQLTAPAGPLNSPATETTTETATEFTEATFTVLAPVAHPAGMTRLPGIPLADAGVSPAVAQPYLRPRIVAGLPSAVPPGRPAHLRHIGPRPAARPGVATATAQDIAPAPQSVAEASATNAQTAQGLGTSLRPEARPETRRFAALVRDAAKTVPAADTRASTRAGTQSVQAASQKPVKPVQTQTADTGPVSAPPPAIYDPRIQLASGTGSCPRGLSRGIPRRHSGAQGGRAFLTALGEMKVSNRDTRVATQILSGNMPDALRQLVPVSFTGQARDGKHATVTLCVMPDYLALGGNRDFVRVPMGLHAATRIADRFDMILPTAQMVDLIYRAAGLRFVPRPMPAGPRMTSTAYLLRHNATVESQRRRAGVAEGVLMSGHKKDLVLTHRLVSHPGRVAIYGWHRPGGKAIQPLSTVHGAGYADYSHGVRLISRTAYLNGRAVDVRQLLGSPDYAALLTREGPIAGRGLRMASLAGN